ncbi:uncharacterized protein EV420DRAFT_1633687 [Desarmillaria tabescens]|uniref:Uncharacterized protein n=1 Tax=Armillaria tabescens TaxID=1929756 RepID=A0AA39NP92_ARMTA|nr:uncharacterized protein EV420DRAFT_1633687 [Desarmillaria tabescens]KAK0469266.1 hypothetical protein EV420DRAFT_1633687 [Desarmillaria tabescens]
MSEQPTNTVQVELPAEFYAALEELRTIRIAQLASVDQQREMARYFTELNVWFEGQVRQRQNDMQALERQVDGFVRGDLEDFACSLAFFPKILVAAFQKRRLGPVQGVQAAIDRDQHTYYSDRQPHESVSAWNES